MHQTWQTRPVSNTQSKALNAKFIDVEEIEFRKVKKRSENILTELDSHLEIDKRQHQLNGTFYHESLFFPA